MKFAVKLSAISWIILITLLLMTSCTVSEKAAVKCPDFYGSSNRHKVIRNKRVKNVSYAVNHRANRKRNSSFRIIGTPEKGVQNTNTEYVNSVMPGNPELPIIMPDYFPVKAEFVKALAASTDLSYMPPVINVTGELSAQVSYSSHTSDNVLADRQTGCDTLVLKTGLRIPVIIDEMGQDYIKYRECGKPDGPIIMISKSVVSEIRILNGEVKNSYFTATNPIVNANTPSTNIEPAKIEGFGIVGVFTSILGFIVAGIPLGALSIIFGFINLAKIGKEPTRWWGRGLGIIAIILGLFDIFAVLIAISTM